jgi:hypothetical protein
MFVCADLDRETEASEYALTLSHLPDVEGHQPEELGKTKSGCRLEIDADTREFGLEKGARQEGAKQTDSSKGLTEALPLGRLLSTASF